MDEALTEDDFYCGPLRGVFSTLARQHILEHVQIMVLDGLTVPADLVQEIVTEDRFNVRVLSIRDARHLNRSKLGQVLRYACRPSRPAGTPKLRAMYVFGDKETSKRRIEEQAAFRRVLHVGHIGVMGTEGAQIGAAWNNESQTSLSTSLAHCEDEWYQQAGQVITQRTGEDWAPVLQACEGIIAFDAVLCRGPRHYNPKATGPHQDENTPNTSWLPAAIANIALGPSGCAKCGTMPEKAAVWGRSPQAYLPLLSPMSKHSTSVKASQQPLVTLGTSDLPFVARCEDCLRNRWCERCLKWWCELCYSGTDAGKRLPEVRHDTLEAGTLPFQAQDKIKVHMGLCTETCLVSEMMSGAGSFGMWG
ncbi:MAG: hypothetical protein M1828_006148 [Chrysothrix sp. TS-e1954]|nr:MAG: hypothetical protein M1828_006148 [Chrysothrix sp. TS-e1954]